MTKQPIINLDKALLFNQLSGKKFPTHFKYWFFLLQSLEEPAFITGDPGFQIKRENGKFLYIKLYDIETQQKKSCPDSFPDNTTQILH